MINQASESISQNRKTIMDTSCSRVFWGKVLIGLIGLGLASCSVLLSGCQVAEDFQGSYIPEHRVKDIRVGQTHRDQVMQWFGSPTFVVAERADVWYYVCQNRQLQSLSLPSVESVKGLAVFFDSQGKVKEVHHVQSPGVFTMDPDSIPAPETPQQSSWLNRLFGKQGPAVKVDLPQ
jgi:outer membrane protein assembly factor BamE (lipoprotein component of BamABCDE complex)